MRSELDLPNLLGFTIVTQTLKTGKSSRKEGQNIKKKTSRKNEEAGATAINPNWPPLNTDEKKRVKNFYLKVNSSAYTANIYSQSPVEVQLIQCKVYSVNCNSAAVLVSVLSVWSTINPSWPPLNTDEKKTV